MNAAEVIISMKTLKVHLWRWIGLVFQSGSPGREAVIALWRDALGHNRNANIALVTERHPNCPR